MHGFYLREDLAAAMNLKQEVVDDLISQKIIPETQCSVLVPQASQQRVLQKQMLYELDDLVIGLVEIYRKEQRSYQPVFGDRIIIFSSDLPIAMNQRYGIQASLGKEGSLLLKNGFCLLEKVQLRNANCSYLLIEDNYLTAKFLMAQTAEEQQAVIKEMQAARERVNVDLVIALIGCSQTDAEKYLKKDAEKKLDKFGRLLPKELFDLIQNVSAYERPVMLNFTIHPAAAVSDAPEPEAQADGQRKEGAISTIESTLSGRTITLGEITTQHGLSMMCKVRPYLQPNADGSFDSDKVDELIAALID